MHLADHFDKWHYKGIKFRIYTYLDGNRESNSLSNL